MANRAVVRKGIERLDQKGFADNECQVCELTTSTVLGFGDLVSLSGATSTDPRYPVVARTVASAVYFGIFAGQVENTHESVPGYYSGTGVKYGLVYPIKTTDILVAQEDGDGGFLSAASTGLVIDIATVTDASSTTGRSNMVLDSSTAVNNAARGFLILGLANETDNVVGDVYTRWKLRPIELQVNQSFDGE